MQSDSGSRGGVIWKEDGAEELIDYADVFKWGVEGIAAGDLLECLVIGFTVCHCFEFSAVVVENLFLISEATRPAEERTDRSAILRYNDIGVQDVALIEAEGLLYLQSARTVLK